MRTAVVADIQGVAGCYSCRPPARLPLAPIKLILKSLVHLGPRQQLLLAHGPEVVQQANPQAAGALGIRSTQLRRQPAGQKQGSFSIM